MSHNETEFGPEFDFVIDSQDREAVAEYFPKAADWSEVTAAFVRVQDGDYAEVWVTESSRPYSTSASFVRVV